MELTILWSWTCVPSLDRSASASFLNIWNLNILIDCWTWTLHQLLRAGIDYKEIDVIFVTHFHPDHVSELNPILQALSWTPWFNRNKKLTLIWPQGFKDFCSQQVHSKTRLNTFDVEIREISEWVLFDWLQVSYIKTIHSPESIAYRFTHVNKSIVFTWDCDYNETIVEFSREADILLIECSFPNNMKVAWHLVSNECWIIGKKANVWKMILNHLYPIEQDTRLDEAKKIFPNTILAEDLLKINL